MYVFKGLVSTDLVTSFFASGTWCRYFRFLLFIYFLYIHSNSVVSGGLFLRNAIIGFYGDTFKGTFRFNNMLFVVSICGKCFCAWCQVATICVFSCHGFLLTCLLRAFSVWNSRNLVLWKNLNIHYFSWCNKMYRNKSYGDIGIVTLGCVCSYVRVTRY